MKHGSIGREIYYSLDITPLWHTLDFTPTYTLIGAYNGRNILYHKHEKLVRMNLIVTVDILLSVNVL